MTLGSILTQTFTFPSWKPEKNLPDLSGKVAAVTGASTGLGLETATELARKGAAVYCFGRSAEKTNAAIEKIKKETGNDKVYFIQADLLDLVSMERAADQLLSQTKQLNILVNNAGIMSTPWGLSAQGIENQFATNHFAHAVLTNKLLATLRSSTPSRIVNLSSLAHTRTSGNIVYENLNNQEAYDAQTRYAETKLSNIHFTKHLQSLIPADEKLYINAVHPGIVATELSRNLDAKVQQERTVFRSAFLKTVSIDAKKGAVTQIFCAGAADIETKNIKGKYFVPYCSVAAPSLEACDAGMAKKTWEWTEEVLKKQFRDDWKWTI